MGDTQGTSAGPMHHTRFDTRYQTRAGDASASLGSPGVQRERGSVGEEQTTPPPQPSWSAAMVRVLVGALLAAVIVLPMTLPYIEVYRTLGIVRSVRELDNWSAPLQAYLAAAPGSWLYGRMGSLFAASGGEFALFPGGLVMLLALIGMLPYRQSSQKAMLFRYPRISIRLFLVLLALIAFILSLGSGLRLTRGANVLPLPLPYTLLYEHLPGFAALRVPARWGMLVALALCLLAALGLERLGRRLAQPWRYGLGSVVLLLVLLENAVLPMPLAPAPNLAQAAAVYRWLGEAQQRDIHVILELPLGRTPRGTELDRSMLRQYLGMLHWKSSPAGYSGLTPFGTLDLLGHIQALPDPQVLHYLQIVGVDTLIIHRNEYEAAPLQKLLSGLDSSTMLIKRAELDDALVYTLLPEPQLDLPAGTRVLVTNDERMPGLLSLALIRRWQAAGVQLYGPGRTRYYSALGAVKPGDSFDYTLLVDTENPLHYGLKAEHVWQSNGLALYAQDPSLRLNLNLGSVPAGRFHPAYPARLEWRLERNSAMISGQRISWSQALEQPMVELDIASLIPQHLKIGDTILDIPAGFSSMRVPGEPGRSVVFEGQPAATAVLRMRVRAASTQPIAPAAGLALATETRFDSSRLHIRIQAGGLGELALEARGAAAYDDKPILLFSGIQPIPPDGGGTWEASVDLLRPDEPWLQQASEAQDGRYIVYIKQAGSQQEGIPIAKFTVRQGQVLDAEPVILPLTGLD